MAQPSYFPPSGLHGASYFGGRIPSLNRLRVLLILSGYGTIEHDGKSIKLKRDFLSIPIQSTGKFKVGSITSKIPGCTNSEFRALIKNAATKNINIHENIFNELVHCIAHLETQSYLASFVHLYRLIEHTALYLPLVSIVSRGVNDITFSQYKEVVNNQAKADLSILKNFSTKVLDPAIGNSISRYSFSNNSNPTAACTVARGLLDSAQINSYGADYFEIKYMHSDRLIITFRNQFFHYLYHDKNISLRDLGDPGEFLQSCLPNFITYFAFLYREFLIAEWELWSN